MIFRTLEANEIEVRVSTVKDNGISLLLYKDARCDMNILDEVIGNEKWQRKHYECKGNLFCSVGILTENQWIWKDDCGVESYTEKQKGESSDSFKRACFNWGIGRELYTAPYIWISADKVKYVTAGNKKTTYDKFFIEKISYDEARKISGLAIKNQAGKRVFLWQKEVVKK